MAKERSVRVVIVGAGMSGILSAIKLREAGYDDFAIYEKADRLGGTWRENTYPGIACDVPSLLYSYSFEPNPEWSHQYSPGGEIQRYFEGVARKYGVEKSIVFGEEITRCTWRDERWQLETRRGKRDQADVVIAASGVLHVPNYPDIAGLETFAGACFHSARWDHEVPLDDRRVGVIGTGSTAVQITSALADRVARFELFQRTAQWVLQVPNPAYTEAERLQFQRDPGQLRQAHTNLAAIFEQTFSNALVDASSPGMAMIEEQCRQNLENNVVDPVLRERLRPNYRAACKRLVMSPDFYETLQKPNVELVTSGIERIEPEGVRTKDGKLHALDVLVLATGFKPDRFMRPTQITGRDGVKLDDVWSKRPTAYLSIGVPGFPNLFMLNGPNGPVGNFSLIEVAELQFKYILQLLAEIRDGRCREISPTQAASDALEAARTEAAKNTIWTTGCKSWYLDDRGVPASWPWGFDRFREEMAKPRLEAYELR